MIDLSFANSLCAILFENTLTTTNTAVLAYFSPKRVCVALPSLCACAGDDRVS